MRHSQKITTERILNCDETSVPIESGSPSTLEVSGARSVPLVGGNERTHMTVMLTACASGRKLPPMVILARCCGSSIREI